MCHKCETRGSQSQSGKQWNLILFVRGALSEGSLRMTKQRPEGPIVGRESRTCVKVLRRGSMHKGLKSGDSGQRGEEERALVQERSREFRRGQTMQGLSSQVTAGETEPHRIHYTFDFSFFFFPPFFLSFFAFVSSSSRSCFFSTNLLPSSFPLPCPLYFFTHRKIKTNYFIVSLAFADLLVSILVMPFGAIELVQDVWIYGEMFCLVRTSLDVLLTTASIFHLCCISLDR